MRLWTTMVWWHRMLDLHDMLVHRQCAGEWKCRGKRAC